MVWGLEATSKLSLIRVIVPDVIIWTAIRLIRRPPKRSNAIRPFSPTMSLIREAAMMIAKEGSHAKKMTAMIFQGTCICWA